MYHINSQKSKINLLHTIKSPMFDVEIISIIPIDIDGQKFIGITSESAVIEIWQQMHQQFKLLKFYQIDNRFALNTIYFSKYFTMAVRVEADHIVFLNILQWETI